MSQNHRVYFVDTSYLTELYGIPGRCDEVAKVTIRDRFANARTRGDRLFVPLGCLLELGNHVAALNSAGDREKWAGILHQEVRQALDPVSRVRPYVLVEAPPLAELSSLVGEWAARHVAAPRGLVDAATAEKAKAYKRDRALGMPVHIWTRDRKLKGVEPDPEPNPFL